MPRHDPIEGERTEEVEEFYDPPETIEGCLQELAAYRAKLLAMSNEELMRECQQVSFGVSYVDQLRLFAAEARGLRPPEPKAQVVSLEQFGLL